MYDDDVAYKIWKQKIGSLDLKFMFKIGPMILGLRDSVRDKLIILALI